MIADQAAGFAALLEKVERERGFCCAAYKASCLQRRVRNRMRLKGAESFEAYFALLDQQPREMDRLVQSLTINVTRFFRNLPIWEAIDSHVVPSVWSSEAHTIRVWSAGCATGAEAFSIAMLFHRHSLSQGTTAQPGRVVVTGTDVDAEVVRLAAQATYGMADVTETPSALRERYLVEEDGALRPSLGVRRLVRFAQHDLLVDPYPVAPQHIIICRNVLIYFERSVQQQVIKRLRDALAPGGFLILGKVESLLGVSGFQRVAPRERIFRKVS